MNRTVYLNGEYLPEDEAKISIFDRGFLMADGVYEVTSVLGGKLIDFEDHAVRLHARWTNWRCSILRTGTTCWRFTASWCALMTLPTA